MVIVTLADLHARDQETSSTPAQNHATPNPKQSQSRQVSSTAALRRQLQALDKALSNIQPGHCNEADIANITEACKSYHDGRTYVNGSEELWLMLRKLWAPQFIPNIYTEAFMALLAGRYHVNNDKYDDSFSTVRDYLGRLDCACETDLEGKLARLEDQVKPFPFLNLPAELRLHVYSYVLPPNGVRFDSYTFHHSHGNRDPHELAIMLVNKQVYDEARKCFYGKQNLLIHASVSKVDSSLQGLSGPIHDVLDDMNPDTLKLFKDITIIVGDVMTSGPIKGRITNPINHALSKLAGVERIFIGFFEEDCFHRHTLPQQYQDMYVDKTKKWLIDNVPASVRIEWDRPLASEFFGGEDAEQRLWQAIQQRA